MHVLLISCWKLDSYKVKMTHACPQRLGWRNIKSEIRKYKLPNYYQIIEIIEITEITEITESRFYVSMTHAHHELGGAVDIY